MEGTFNEFLHGFTDSSELESWAFKYGLSHITEVKNRLSQLKLQEIVNNTNIREYSQTELKDVIDRLEQYLDPPLHMNDTPSVIDSGQSKSQESNSVQQHMPIVNNMDTSLHTTTAEPLAGTSKNKRKISDQNTPPRKKIKSDFRIKENEHAYTLSSRSSKSFRGNVLLERTFDVKFNNNLLGSKLVDIKKTLRDIFNSLLEKSSSEFQETDIARLYINHSDLNKPIIVPPRELRLMTPENILAQVSSTLQSAEHLTLNNTFSIQLGIARIKKGGTRTYITNIEKDRISKRSIVSIRNIDNLCLPRALVVGSAYNDMINADTSQKQILTKRYQHIRRGDMNRNSSIQKKKALELIKKVGLSCDKLGYMTDLPLYEVELNTDIVVFGLRAGKMSAIYPESRSLKRKNRVYLLYTEDNMGLGHFDCVVKMTGLLSKDYFCPSCLYGYNNINTHKCRHFCSACKASDCVYEYDVVCSDCNGVFHSAECFQRHKTRKGKFKTSFCEKYWFCQLCKAEVLRHKIKPSEHVCGNYICHFCKNYVDDDHKCYLRYTAPKKEISKYIYFDFECDVSGETHNPLFCISQTVCNICENIPFEESNICLKCGTRCTHCDKKDEDNNFVVTACTETCGRRENIFSGVDCAEEFCKWLLHKQNKNCVCFAHNARSYDSYFLIQYMLRNAIVPHVIFSGAKIMQASVTNGLNITILDSISFLPMALSKLPKSFEIENTTKGFFPYHSLKPETMYFVGEIPDIDSFGIQSMKSDKRKDFMDWYDSQKDIPFDMMESLLKYTRDDVKILRIAMTKFRQLVLSVTTIDDIKGVDPFQYVTLASLVMGIFKKLFLCETVEVTLDNDIILNAEKKNEKIYIENRPPLHVKDPQIKNIAFKKTPIAACTSNMLSKGIAYSNYAILWIKHEEHKRGIYIQHALNSGEKKVVGQSGRSYSLDGFHFDENTGEKISWEFEGCLYHACEKCYPDGSVEHPFFKNTMKERRAATRQKVAYLESLGFTVIQMWECTFKELLKSDQDLIDFSKTVDLTPRLYPRDSLYGGRTDTCQLYYQAKEGETIKYFDYTSLYPSVLKKKRFPVSHAQVLRTGFKSIDEYFGIAKIQILPPKNLYHAVLPVKINKKLCFPLCKTCAENMNQNECICSEDDRMLHGTWTTIEISKAVERGYIVTKIHEVYHWDEVGCIENGNGLFSEFVDTFLKIKQESSGWPDWVSTEEDRQKYLKEYLEHEGILLNPANIQQNPGLRAISKLCLNSLWGKFAQKTNLRKSKFIETESQFYSILCDRTCDIQDWHIINPKMVQIEYSMVEGFECPDRNSNIFIAIFTTAYARLELYDLIDKLGENTLYMDTDSVIFKHSEGAYCPPLGDFLGELTCETPSTYITEFVSTGAKSYAFQQADGIFQVRVKGFTLDHENSKKLNFQTMKKMVLDFQENERSSNITLNYPKTITRNAHRFTIQNVDQNKEFSVTLDKRRIDFRTLNTYPYGY